MLYEDGAANGAWINIVAFQHRFHGHDNVRKRIANRLYVGKQLAGVVVCRALYFFAYHVTVVLPGLGVPDPGVMSLVCS